MSDLIQMAMASGNINISKPGALHHAPTAASKLSSDRHNELLKAMEAKRRARTVAVPTNNERVKEKLRKLRHPITLFGEGPAERRERLRGILAELAVSGRLPDEDMQEEEDDRQELKQAFLTEGTHRLRDARLEIAKWSLPRASARLKIQRQKWENPEDGQDEREEEIKEAHCNRMRDYANLSSEVGDSRPISSCNFSSDSKFLAIASWSGQGKIFSVPDGKHLFNLKGNDNRLSDVQFRPGERLSSKEVNLATACVDGDIRLYPSEGVKQDAVMLDDDEEDNIEEALVLKPVSKLKGHADRLTTLKFHPSGNFLASGSYDSTWRLWDVRTCQQLLMQGGHSRGVYGLAIHRDGSLLASGDLGGICRLWDLRTGKAVHVMPGHVTQVLSMDFSPNGYHLASGSDDNTVVIHDLRMRRTLYTIPAHSNLISSVRYQPDAGSFLVTASYDSTCKLWTTSDFSLITTLAGHEGKILDVDISQDSTYISTASFDRTFKLWTSQDNI